MASLLPSRGHRGQVHHVGVRFLRAHPELRHLTASSLIAEALAEAFHCPARPGLLPLTITPTATFLKIPKAA